MTDRQDDLLAKHDGRYFAVGKFNTGLAMLMKTEKIGKESSVDFGLPSGPALFLNLAKKGYIKIKDAEPAAMFYKWENAKVPTNHSSLFDYFELFLSHVVFSFTAIEAFANEAIPDSYVHEKLEKDGTKTMNKQEIERATNLDEKLHLVLPKALGISSPKRTKLWQNYRKLKKMRDRIIHLKKVDRSPSGTENESVWGMMLRSHGEPFCDQAHLLIGHYKPAGERRWFQEYPYEITEIDKLFK